MSRPADEHYRAVPAKDGVFDGVEEGVAQVPPKAAAATTGTRSLQRRAALGLVPVAITALILLGVRAVRPRAVTSSVDSVVWAATSLVAAVPDAVAATPILPPRSGSAPVAPARGALATLPAAAAAAGTCAGMGDDCTASQCCKDAGFQCFTKSEYFATCRPYCEPGMKDEDGSPWACMKLGAPAPFESGPERCAWSGENCGGKRCCNDANMKCFKRNSYFAGCKFTAPADWDKTQLGEFRGWHQIVAPAPAGKETQGTKLFCFVVQSPNPRVHEDQLIQRAREMKLGIFSCDENSVYMGAAAPPTAWQSVSNINVFIAVWDQVKAEGKFWHNDWTVKVDSDAVFFGNRLKQHLDKLRVPKYEPVYIKNCNFKFWFQGSLEIFSEKAMELYVKYGHLCSAKIGHEGGEDFYMMTCMDAMGVGAMSDIQVLDDKYTRLDHLVLDDVAPCKNGWTAAFHPYRDADVWAKCATAALQAEQQFAATHKA